MGACSCRSLSARLSLSVKCHGVEGMACSRNDTRQERSDKSEESGTEQHIRNTTSEFWTHFKVLDIGPMRGFLSEAANFCLQLVLTTIRRMCLPWKETLVFCAFRPLGRAATIRSETFNVTTFTSLRTLQAHNHCAVPRTTSSTVIPCAYTSTYSKTLKCTTAHLPMLEHLADCISSEETTSNCSCRYTYETNVHPPSKPPTVLTADHGVLRVSYAPHDTARWRRSHTRSLRHR